MTETIIVALITGGLSLLGVIITSNKTTRDVQAKLDTQQAVTDTKLDELTREVREHNNFARRVPVLEEQIKVANHRIADLERLPNRWASQIYSMRRYMYVSRYNPHADIPPAHRHGEHHGAVLGRSTGRTG